MGWSPGAKEKDWPLAGGIIISLGSDEFYVAGTGLVVTFKPKATGSRAGILSIDKGRFVNGKLVGQQAYEWRSGSPGKAFKNTCWRIWHTKG